MSDSISRIRYSWDAQHAKCRATAYDAAEGILADVVVELPQATQQRIWGSCGAGSQFRIEETAERQLRTMLDLGR